ncbi:DUF1837 domain-containing protein [Ferrimicrobium sp.]|uniref:HamA C-terminal domain-containing protein n=1 Tax=Ferrimicrobium sp. TaxID=2926050 RepID=UPI00260C07A7|nr:DUF1837 domain-containing protein [Ferrimicrobium sp.]
MSTANVVQDLRDDGAEPWFVSALERLPRGDEQSLEPYLTLVGEATALPNTLATCRFHYVRVDPQGNPRVQALVNMLTDRIVDYCVPRSRINEAFRLAEITKSTDSFLKLQREAKELFANVSTTGEGGELLLYALLEMSLGLPQILCKMPLKTNSQMHSHGVDGVHARALPDGKLAVYYGEAKMHRTVTTAIDAVLESLAPYLLDVGNGMAQRDILLLRDNLDAGDAELTAALARYFTEGAMEASQLVVRGACLVGFSLGDYSSPQNADASIRGEVAEAMNGWRARLVTAITNKRLTRFELEIFLVPLPSVQDFRDEFLRSLGLAK